MSAPSESSNGAGHRLAVDIGGTFIDYVLLDEATGEFVTDKEAAFRDAIAEQLFVGYDRLVEGGGATLARFVHGSTLAINTILQENGAKVGLITTRGFRDVLEIGRGNRTEVYDFAFSPPRPLVPRHLRREVTERTDFRGNEVAPLDLAELEVEVEALVAQGVDAIAICFLHAYADPSHEREAADWIGERHPELFLTRSSDVATEWREFERTSTAVLNAYVMPVIVRYLGQVQDGLDSRRYRRPLTIMQSNGGVMAADVAKRVPIRMLESGPAGGVIGAQALATAIGEPNVICADVGGTSFDVALIRDGNAVERFRTDVEGRPVLAPSVDIISVGSGGGSVAWIDERGQLRVGPRSAGSRPGPACFRQGGDEPTVTDCNLVLGRLDAERFLGSRMPLDRQAAEDALRPLAEELGMSVADAAAGVVRVAETDMSYALRLMTVERGYDPRDFALLGYGGGGGLFAAALSLELEIPRVIVPAAAGVFSAWGLLFADFREDAARTRVLALDGAGRADFIALLAEVRAEAVERLAEHGIDRERALAVSRADVRFRGQEHTLTVPVPALERADEVVAAVRDAFVERHRAHYGQADETRDVEVVTVRASATAKLRHPDLARSAANGAEGRPRGERDVWFSATNRFETTEIWSRDAIGPRTEVCGPAVIEEWNATTPVGPGQSARRDELDNLIIT